MRKLLENVHYSPNVGRFKVYLIDEVHMLSTASFNALLKTLEEPPSHVKFIFATTDPKKVPLTVLSRCLQFHLRNIEPSTVKEQLQTILTEENIPFDEESLHILARASQGSMRDALSLTDQAISHGGGSISIDRVTEMLGTVRTDEVSEIFNLLVQGDRNATLEFINRLSKQAVSFADLLENLQRSIHELALAQITGQIDTEQLQPFIGTFSGEWLQVAYQILVVGMRDLKYAPDHKIGFEMTIIRLLDFEPIENVAMERATRPSNKTKNKAPPQDGERTTTTKSSSGSPTISSSAQENSHTVQKRRTVTKTTPTKQESSNPETTIASKLVADREALLQDPIVSSIIKNFDAEIIDIKRTS